MDTCDANGLLFTHAYMHSQSNVCCKRQLYIITSTHMLPCTSICQTHLYSRIQLHTYTLACMQAVAYIYTCMHASSCIHIHLHACKQLHTYTLACMQAVAYIYTGMHACSYMHAPYFFVRSSSCTCICILDSKACIITCACTQLCWVCKHKRIHMHMHTCTAAS
jgi:hypothetical protein